jgi:TolA-binding protein
VTANEELARLCHRLGDVETPFDEIGRSRAEARLGAALVREPAPRGRGALGWTVAAFLAGAAAAAAVAFVIVSPARSRVAGSAQPALRFEPYVVAPLAAASASAMPETLMRSSSHLDVPAGWLVRASLGDAVAVTLTGPARAWAERAASDGRVVVHLEDGRLLASLDGRGGRRLAIVSPGAVTEVVGTLFAVEVVGGASRIAVAHGRVAVSAAPPAADAQGRAPPREITGGESWLTAQPEKSGLPPALAEALGDHERTPPPRGDAVALSVTEAPPGADVWVGKQRIASAPAWVRVEARAAVRLSVPAAAGSRAAPVLVPPPPPPESPPRRHAAVVPPAPEPPVLSPPSDVAPPPLVPAEMTARTLFREADQARAAGDGALALRTLRALVTRFPRDPSTSAARYELALMEHATGAGDAALGDLAAVDDPALDEPARYLRCRVLATRAAAAAGRCFADFRRQFPASPHDGDALATQAALALARGGCPAARAPLTELARRYPAHRSIAHLRVSCPEVP